MEASAPFPSAQRSVIQVPWEGWNHFDFLFAIDIDQYQNQHLVEVLKEYPIP